jgi:hypothetical protein
VRVNVTIASNWRLDRMARYEVLSESVEDGPMKWSAQSASVSSVSAGQLVGDLAAGLAMCKTGATGAPAAHMTRISFTNNRLQPRSLRY